MSDWVESGREPALTDMFDDPIVRILMESDRTSQAAIERLLSAAAKVAVPDVPIALL
jgi:hypothetical protein